MQALQHEGRRRRSSRKPYVAHVASVVGGSFGSSTANQGNLFVELKRNASGRRSTTILADLRRTLGRIPGISSFVVPVQNLRIGGVSTRRASTSSSCRGSTATSS